MKKIMMLIAGMAIVLGCSTIRHVQEGSGTTFAKNALAPMFETGQFPGAGLWTTANDQLKFYQMLMNLGMG